MYRSSGMFLSVVVFFVSMTVQASVVYNTWYARDGVLYDVTQTAESEPVAISLSSTGSGDVGMVISYENKSSCDDNIETLKIDKRYIQSEITCLPTGDTSIITYIVSEPKVIAYVLGRLRSDFTVILMGDIKIWAANIKKPLYGIGCW
ncbi:hypothetical protein [Enterobacter mori]|uniref:hypothetical protein n=1 Tax=Enterobacter mori TaxID=539813 RepID=UPI003B8421E6